MGITAGDEEDDDYNPLDAKSVKEDTDIGESDERLKKITVDAQTRREYWLGKSNTLTNGNIE